mgnify:CR=1 FL=1
MENRILLIEDDPDITELVRINLEDAGYRLDSAADGEKGLETALAQEIDLVILDLQLPRMDGLEVCRQLQQRKRHLPILMLTSRSEEVDRVLGLELGADDYLTKPFSIRELVARVRAILRRLERSRTTEKESVDSPLPLDLGDLIIDPDRRRVTLDGEPVELTAKEFDLLLMFASHPGRVYSRQMLLELVWGRPEHMKRYFASFYGKLSAIFLLLLLAAGLVHVWVTLDSYREFERESNQGLNRDLAAHLAERFQPFLADSDYASIEHTFHDLMVMNPFVEIYLIDESGVLLAYFADPAKIKRSRIDLAPVLAYVDGGSEVPFPLYGDNPRSLDQRKPFSAVRVTIGKDRPGFLYVILGGEQYDSAAAMIRKSYIIAPPPSALLSSSWPRSPSDCSPSSC